MSTLLKLQSRFGDKPLKFQVVCPQNGTALLKALMVVLIVAVVTVVVAKGGIDSNSRSKGSLCRYLCIEIYPLTALTFTRFNSSSSGSSSGSLPSICRSRATPACLRPGENMGSYRQRFQSRRPGVSPHYCRPQHY